MTEPSPAIAERLRQRRIRPEDFEEEGRQLISNEFVHHGLQDRSGMDALDKLVGTIRTGFPDVEVEFRDIVQQGDLLALHYTWTGTHQGEIWGLSPTGVKVTADGVDMLRVRDGKVVEYWPGGRQVLSTLQQLGVLNLEDGGSKA